MFIAHLPAGLLLTQVLIKGASSTELSKSQYVFLLFAGLTGSILPDFDLLYYLLIDNQQHWHHDYWTHMPYYWTCLFLFALVYCKMIQANRLVFSALLILYLNVILHLVLDTLVGGIYWLYPMNDTYLSLVEIRPRFDWWVLNFVLHWTFALELTIIILAVSRMVFLRFSYQRS